MAKESMSKKNIIIYSFAGIFLLCNYFNEELKMIMGRSYSIVLIPLLIVCALGFSILASKQVPQFCKDIKIWAPFITMVLVIALNFFAAPSSLHSALDLGINKNSRMKIIEEENLYLNARVEVSKRLSITEYAISGDAEGGKWYLFYRRGGDPEEGMRGFMYTEGNVEPYGIEIYEGIINFRVSKKNGWFEVWVD